MTYQVPKLTVLVLLTLIAGTAWSESPTLLSHEVPRTEKSATTDKPVISGMTFRQWMAATKFPVFKFSGTFEAAIMHLMAESKKFSPDGRTVGGFIIKEQSPLEASVNVDLKEMNALELINELCRVSDANWTLEYSIIIQKQGEQIAK